MTAARLLAIGVLFIGCTDLPAISLHVCGNRVIEPEAGEDCDTFSAEGSQCIPAGEPNQCRYACAPSSGGGGPDCPAGMGCGTDGICRAASGAFSEVSATVEARAHELIAADFDGDRRTDVLSVESDSVTAHYFDEALGIATSVVMLQNAVSRCFPIVGELTSDERADVVLPAGLGVVIMIGTRNRSLKPSAHPGIAVTGGVEQLTLMPAHVLVGDLAQQIVVLGTVNGGSGLAYIPTSGVPDILAVMPNGADSLAGPMLARNFDTRPSSPCDEGVVSYTGFDHLVTYPFCTPDKDGKPALNHGGALGSVALGGAVIEVAARAIDVNRDGHLDLAVIGKRSDALELDVAYGVGDGTFHSDATGIPTTSGDQAAGLYAGLSLPTPLALGHLDGDAVLDYVLPGEIRTSLNGSFGDFLTNTNFGEPWTEAEITDANEDGFTDVITLTESAHAVTFFSGAGNGLVTGSTLTTPGLPSQLTVGDYDGDHVDDLAIVEHPDASEANAGDTVSVMFGALSGTPAPPVAMGTIDPVVRAVAVLGREPNTRSVDSAQDVVTMSRTDTGSFVFSSFAGSGDRIMRAPYVTTESTAVPMGVPVITGYFPLREALGEFTGDDHADLATLVRTGDDSVHRFWITPSTGSARLHVDTSIKSDPGTESFAWANSLFVALDLDGDGIDEVVALGHEAGRTSAGVAMVGRVVTLADGTPGVAIDDPLPLAFSFDREERATVTSTPGAPGAAIDLDLDGKRDLVAVGARGDPAVRRLVVFFNGGSGSLGEPVEVETGGSDEPIDFAILQADADRELELAVITGTALHLVDVDPERRTFSVRPKPAAATLDATSVAAGDVDGDGVADLAVSSPTAIRMFRGSAVHR